MCRRAFSSYDAGTIAFEQSTDRFRQSAIPELDRLVALVDACRQGKVRVTGHTDASGNEAANHALSLQRANAVIDYLVVRGIDADRLLSRGAGAGEPVADNSTRYGRSLNRRIEIEFLQP